MSAMNKIAFVAVVLGLTGCAGTRNMAKTEGATADFKQDLSACKYEALKHAYVENDWWSALVRSEEVTKACLLRYGWDVNTEDGQISSQSQREKVKVSSLF